MYSISYDWVIIHHLCVLCMCMCIYIYVYVYTYSTSIYNQSSADSLHSSLPNIYFCIINIIINYISYILIHELLHILIDFLKFWCHRLLAYTDTSDYYIFIMYPNPITLLTSVISYELEILFL